MKYIKTFEAYDIASDTDIDKDAIESEISKKVEELSPEQMDKVRSELEAFARKNGLSFEDLKDADKVTSILQSKAETANESWIGDKLKKISGFLFKTGLVGFAATIVAAGTTAEVIGEKGMELASNQLLTGSIAGIGFAISALCLLVGSSMGKGKEMAKETGATIGRSRRG